MAQRRYINFGDTVLAQRINDISTAIVSPGVLDGAAFSRGLGTNTLNVGPSKVMLNELLLVENSDTSLLIGTTDEGGNVELPTSKTDYTIVYEHSNQQVQGGAPAVLLSVEGLFGFQDLDNSVVLGWVRYPGGSVPISDNMFVEAPKLQIRNPSVFQADVKVPPFLPRTYVQFEENPGAVQTSDVYSAAETQAYLLLDNVSFSDTSIVHRFPFIAGIEPPNRIILEAKVPLASSITASIVDEEGTVYAAEEDTITNTSGIFEAREMLVTLLSKEKFVQNRPYFVQLTTQLNPGKQLQVSIVGTSSNPLPVK